MQCDGLGREVVGDVGRREGRRVGGGGEKVEGGGRGVHRGGWYTHVNLHLTHTHAFRTRFRRYWRHCGWRLT